MSARYRSALKALAAAGVFCGVYPMVMALREFFLVYYGAAGAVTLWPGLAYQAAVFALMAGVTSAAVGHPGFFPVWFFRVRGDAERAAGHVAAACCILLMIPVTLLIWRAFSDYYECAATLLLCMMAVRCGMRTYNAVTDMAAVVLSVASTMIAALLNWYMGGNLLFVFPAFMGVFAFSAMLVTNQSGLERYIASKRRMAALIPGKIRRRGTAAVTVLFAAMLGITLFYRQVSAALLFVIRTVLAAIIFAVNWIGEQLSKLLNGSVPAPPGGDGDILPPAQESSPVWDAILYLLIMAVTAFALYKLLPKMPRLVKRLWKRLKTFLKALVTAMSGARAYDAEADCADFVDEVEQLTPDGPRARSRRRRFSRAREPGDPVGRMRFIYSRIALVFLPRATAGKGARSATAGELCRAAAELTRPGESEPADSFGRLTALYEKTRYRGDVPGGGELDEARRCAKTAAAHVRRADTRGEAVKPKIKRVGNPFW